MSVLEGFLRYKINRTWGRFYMGVVRKREVSRMVPGFWLSGLVGGTISCDREYRDERIFGGSK